MKQSACKFQRYPALDPFSHPITIGTTEARIPVLMLNKKTDTQKEEKESPSPGPGLEDLECHFCSEKATHKEMMLVGIVLHAYNPNI